MNTTAILTNSLSERAMLVRLRKSIYSPYAFDRDTTAKVEVDTGVARAGRFSKRLLLDCTPLKETIAAYNAVYSYHMLNTVPWLDDGVRMLPSAQYFDYGQAISGLMSEASMKADRLASQWDLLVADDMSRLGSLARSNDYPTNIRERFDVFVRYMPVPSTQDFRVAITDDDRASLEGAIREAEGNVSRHLITEMLEPIKHAVAKLRVPIGDEGSKFRNSLVENINDAVSRAKRLNVTNDPQVAEMVDQLEREFCESLGQVPQVLRESDSARAEARAKLEATMSKMSGWF
jgi:hypothetical protein